MKWMESPYLPVIIATIGAILAIAAAAVQAYNSDLTEKKRVGEYEALLKKSNDALDSNQKTLEKADEQIAKLESILENNKKLLEDINALMKAK